MNPALLANRIKAVIERSRIDVSTEAAAHTAIFEALERDGLDPRREVRLTARDRIDIMVASVAVEVKVAPQRRLIFKQLQRYATLSEVDALVLASAAAWPGDMSKIGSTPFFFANLSRGWL
jgi:hypothetical protein